MVGLGHSIVETYQWIRVPFSTIILIETGKHINLHRLLLLFSLPRFKPIQVQLLMVTLLQKTASTILAFRLLFCLVNSRSQNTGIPLHQHVPVRLVHDPLVSHKIALTSIDIGLFLFFGLSDSVCPRILLVLEGSVKFDLGEDEQLGTGYVADETCLIWPIFDCIIFAMEHTLADIGNLHFSEIIVCSLFLRVFHLG